MAVFEQQLTDIEGDDDGFISNVIQKLSTIF